MRVLVVASLLLLVDMLAGQSLNEVTECTTPNGHYGSCILLESCQSLVRLVTTSGPNVLEILRKSQCGFVGTKPKVCCANNDNPIHFRDPEATTSPTPLQPPVTTQTTLSTTAFNFASKPKNPIFSNSFSQFVPEQNSGPQKSSTQNHPDNDRILDDDLQNVRTPIVSDTMSPHPIQGPGINIASANKHDTSHRGDVLPATNACGIIAITNKIHGGENTSIDDFPWMVLLKYTTETNAHYGCGGVLINRRYVLTAAHCARPGIGYNLSQVRLGEWNLETEVDCASAPECNAPPVDMSIEDVVVHPKFDKHNLTNDIALIRLAQTVNYSDWVQPICLPDSEDRDYTDQTFWVAGWGQTDSGTTSPLKLKLEVRHVSLETCAVAYRLLHISLGAGSLCAGGRLGEDTCAGDSGGPLMKLLSIDSSSNLYAVGVVSLGPSRCGLEGWAGVYSKVSHYIEWIRSSLRP